VHHQQSITVFISSFPNFYPQFQVVSVTSSPIEGTQLDGSVDLLSESIFKAQLQIDCYGAYLDLKLFHVIILPYHILLA
jgi:hypothetical protein